MLFDDLFNELEKVSKINTNSDDKGNALSSYLGTDPADTEKVEESTYKINGIKYFVYLQEEFIYNISKLIDKLYETKGLEIFDDAEFVLENFWNWDYEKSKDLFILTEMKSFESDNEINSKVLDIYNNLIENKIEKFDGILLESIKTIEELERLEKENKLSFIYEFYNVYMNENNNEFIKNPPMFIDSIEILKGLGTLNSSKLTEYMINNNCIGNFMETFNATIGDFTNEDNKYYIVEYLGGENE